MNIRLIGLILFVAVNCTAGPIVERINSEPEFDAWALKQQLIQQHQWQQSLRQQQALNWLYVLPEGCVEQDRRYQIYVCGHQFWRAYKLNEQQLYIQIDPPEQPSSRSGED